MYQDNAMEETKACEQIVLGKSDTHKGKEKNETKKNLDPYLSRYIKKLTRRVIDVHVKAKTIAKKKTWKKTFRTVDEEKIS